MMIANLYRQAKATLGVDDFVKFVKTDWHSSYPFILIYLSIAIGINYYLDFEDSYLDTYSNQAVGTLYYFLFNLSLYIIPLCFMLKIDVVSKAVRNYEFWGYILFALFMFALFQSINLASLFFEEQYSSSYFSRKLGYRLNTLGKYLILFLVLGVAVGRLRHSGFGFFNFKIQYKTYLGFLLIMLPLLVFASTQDDFLKVYPKLKQFGVSSEEYLSQLLIYEPVYLLNFVMLEWFFRGFMVLFFKKYLNTKAIILVAVIYCAFHFGKPALECISSFFGGYLLGYIVYKTKSIWGGVIVHMGIAFLMDLFAYLSKTFFT
jgi:membrane protease YdiL (CAAX protease family)